MTQLYDRFYIPLPGSRKRLPQTPHREISPEESGAADQLAYLRGVPGLPDLLAHLAAIRRPTKAEARCISKYIGKLAHRIKKARTKWERETSAVVDSL